MRKLKKSSGETLVETLVAILIVTLSSLLFLQMTMTSLNISGEAKKMDTDYQASLSAAEEQKTKIATGTITVSGRDYSVTYYGTGETGALTAYSGEAG